MWQLRNNEQSWGHCVGQLACRSAISPDARSGVNSPLSEPLITLTAHKAVTEGTKCPCPELCDQDVPVTKLIHVCEHCASQWMDGLELRWALMSSASLYLHQHLLLPLSEACVWQITKTQDFNHSWGRTACLSESLEWQACKGQLLKCYFMIAYITNRQISHISQQEA